MVTNTLGKLSDEMFEDFLNIGFTIDEINENLDIFCEGYIDDAAFHLENEKNIVLQNIKHIKKEYDDPRFILHMFINYPEAFTKSNVLFAKYMDKIKEQLGNNYLSILDDDYYDIGECELFHILSCMEIEQISWDKEIKRLNHLVKQGHFE